MCNHKWVKIIQRLPHDKDSELGLLHSYCIWRRSGTGTVDRLACVTVVWPSFFVDKISHLRSKLEANLIFKEPAFKIICILNTEVGLVVLVSEIWWCVSVKLRHWRKSSSCFWERAIYLCDPAGRVEGPPRGRLSAFDQWVLWWWPTKFYRRVQNWSNGEKMQRNLNQMSFRKEVPPSVLGLKAKLDTNLTEEQKDQNWPSSQRAIKMKDTTPIDGCWSLLISTNRKAKYI